MAVTEKGTTLYVIEEQDLLEKLYEQGRHLLRASTFHLLPLANRLLRLAALPYLMARGLRTAEEPVPALKAISDMAYIFFFLKTYPDHYFACRMWEMPREEYCYYYGSIYDSYQKKRLRREVHKVENFLLFDNKYVCHLLCQAAGYPVPPLYRLLHPVEGYREEIEALVAKKTNVKVVIKMLDGRGGRGIALAYREDGAVRIKGTSCDTDLAHFELNTSAIAEGYVEQHPELAALSQAVNTIRVLTLLTRRDEVLVAAAILRIGTKDSIADNLSSGGVGVAVDVRTGRLCGAFIDKHGNRHLRHPEGGYAAEGLRIPHWDKVLDLVRDAQKHFSFHKLIGFDVAVTESGPVIIELNAEPDTAGMEMIYGPFLRDRAVWREFNDYGLLVNKKSRQLYVETAPGGSNDHTA